VDNSYYPFIPNLKINSEEGAKPFGKYPLQKDTEKMIRDRLENPQKYKTFAFGDHKRQKDQKVLPHPYQQELEDFDLAVSMMDLPTQVKPQKYLGLDNTPFSFVETEE
jgi:hypothetical protein